MHHEWHLGRRATENKKWRGIYDQHFHCYAEVSLGSEALFFYLVYVHWAACSLSGWLCCSSFATKSGREGGKVVSGTFVFFHCLFCGYCLLFLWDVRRKTPTLSHPPKKKWYPTSKLLNVWLAVFLFSVLWLWMCGSQDSGMNFLILF